MTAARPRILIDTREQTPWTFSAAVETERVTLPTGDYSAADCSDIVALERKSLADFVACVGPERERFMDVCRRLQVYPVRAVLVESSLYSVVAHNYRSHTSPSSVIGTAAAIHVDYGVPVLWCGPPSDAAMVAERMLVRVWNRQRRGLGVRQIDAAPEP